MEETKWSLLTLLVYQQTTSIGKWRKEMNQIQPIVNDIVYLGENGETSPVPVSYREREAEGVPTLEDLPGLVVQPQGTGYSVLALSAEPEQMNQVAEQIVGKFNYENRTNEKGDLKLEDVRRDQHGATQVIEFLVGKNVK